MTSLALPQPDKRILSRQADIAKDLARLVPESVLVTSDMGRRAFETDALTAYRRIPLLAVLPSSTAEVQAIMRYCFDKKIKVVARGAGTSLCGGALPLEDGIVIGVSRMNRIIDVNYANRTATVQAGVTNLAVSNAVAAEDYFYAPDPSSQLACTIAGNIAMNSGGAHCLRYGVTTNNVMGVTLVLADGEKVEIGGDYLDQPGYDILGLINGSEGQFGLVTEATLRILRSAEDARPMLIGFGSIAQAGECVAAIIGSGIIPCALEFMDRHAIHACENFAHAGYPLDVEALLIVEVEGHEEEISWQLDKIGEIALKHNPLVVRTSQSADETERIWRGRKSAFGAMGQIDDYYCMDGTIPTRQLSQVLGEISALCDRYGFRVANIFHAGDGNLHPLILYNANDAEELEKAEECGADILRLCVEAGGCLTGEHGVGIEKRDLMPVQFSETDLKQQMRLKEAFDPEWLLNPAKVFPLEMQRPLQD